MDRNEQLTRTMSKPWTEAQDATLRRMFRQGYAAPAIAHKVNRSVGAVETRIWFLSLRRVKTKATSDSKYFNPHERTCWITG
jgi:hypothetical protein